MLHLIDALLEAERFKLLTRVAAGLGELLNDVCKGGESYVFRDVFLQVHLGASGGILEQLLHGRAGVSRNAVYELIALGVHCAGVERMAAVADAQEAGGLFEGLGAETGHLAQFLAGLEGVRWYCDARRC